jgi:putative ubiquitin-RnfH superfamily antitoxin RatB of RatAB toxin-antitoxin module
MIRVSVAVALADRQEVIEIELEQNSTVQDALAAARLHERFPEIDVAKLKAGVWSRVARPSTVLRDGDRVELYRELAADPKEARRARARLRTSPRSRNAP